MVKLALLVRLEAKPGKEKELEDLVTSSLPMAQNEPGTIHLLSQPPVIEQVDLLAAKVK